MATSTQYYGLVKPPSGETGWTSQVNGNFDAIDAALHALAQGGTTGPAGAQGPAGPAGMNFTGPWSSIISYKVNDVVTFNGSTYIAIANNVNTPPNTNSNSWSLLAAAGAAGPQGATGPQGPAGNGAGVTFPITIAEGGTGAEDAVTARTNLGAAGSGVNADITRLTALTTPNNTGAGQPGILVTSNGGQGQAILWNNGSGGNSGGILTDGTGYFSSILMNGGITCGSALISGLLQANQMGCGTPGSPIEIVSLLLAAAALIVQGGAPTVSANQLGLGAGTSPGTASPAEWAGFLNWNAGGNNIQIPYKLA